MQLIAGTSGPIDSEASLRFCTVGQSGRSKSHLRVSHDATT